MTGIRGICGETVFRNYITEASRGLYRPIGGFFYVLKIGRQNEKGLPNCPPIFIIGIYLFSSLLD
jgi:hypothetical protein